MNPEDYIRELIRKVPGIVKDAMDPQIIQAELAVDISDNMGDNVPNPVYPRPSGAKTLQLVTSKLFRAATVYKAAGNVSKTTGSGTSFSFQWGIDLKVVPYARIHEFGGTINHPGGTPYFIKDGELRFVRKANGARFPKTKPHPIEIPARPYITPALEAFTGGNKTINAAGFTGSVDGFSRIINEIYLKLATL